MFRRLSALSFCLLVTSFAPAVSHAGPADVVVNDPHAAHRGADAPGLAARVREVTAIYRDINEAIAAGYAQFGGCVSGPEAGAMGVHFVKGSLVDGNLDVTQPEALIYEFKGGYARLLGVEYIAPAPAWDAAHDGPPVLQGQHLHLLGSPNRYRLPALYELHVWAWRENPQGTFADWNQRVSCDGSN